MTPTGDDVTMVSAGTMRQRRREPEELIRPLGERHQRADDDLLQADVDRGGGHLLDAEQARECQIGGRQHADRHAAEIEPSNEGDGGEPLAIDDDRGRDDPGHVRLERIAGEDELEQVDEAVVVRIVVPRPADPPAGPPDEPSQCTRPSVRRR